MHPVVPPRLTLELDLCHRVRSQVGHSFALLRAAEQQLRLHNTDVAIDLLGRAESYFSNAKEFVLGVPHAERFAMQQRVEEIGEQIEDFRFRMGQL